jgi:BASS family bile acid:Na+ symporter
MLSIGLQTQGGALAAVLRNRRLLARSLLAAAVLVPVIGVAVARVAPLAPSVAAGITLMALAPGGTLGLRFTQKGDPAYATAMQFLLSAVALVFTPLLVHAVLPAAGAIHLPRARLVALVAVAMVLPLAVGYLVGRKAPEVARSSLRAVGIISSLSFVVAFIVTAAPLKAAAKAQVGREGLTAALAVVVLSMVVGWLLGGPGRQTRRVLMTKASVRNAAAALLIAHHAFADPLVTMTVIAYTAVMVPANFLVSFALDRGARKRPRVVRPAY